MSETSTELVLPVTGEIVNLDDPPKVARALADLTELQRMLSEVRAELKAALLLEAKRQGTKTLHLQGAEVKIGGDRRLVWDVPKLMELRDAGLPEDRLDALLRPIIEYKPDGRVIRQLEGANEDYARIIQEARTYEPIASPWVGVEVTDE